MPYRINRGQSIRACTNTTEQSKTAKLVKTFAYAQHHSRNELTLLVKENLTQDWRPVFLATAELTSTTYATALLFKRVDWSTMGKMLETTVIKKNFTILKWLLKRIDTRVRIPPIVYTIDRRAILTIILARFYETQLVDHEFLKRPELFDLYLKYAPANRALRAYIVQTEILDIQIVSKILEKGVDWKDIDLIKICEDCYQTKLTPPLLELFVKYGFDIKTIKNPLVQVFIEYFQQQMEKIQYTLGPGIKVLELIGQDFRDTSSYTFYKAFKAQVEK